jgi:hypothetical protein
VYLLGGITFFSEIVLPELPLMQHQGITPHPVRIRLGEAVDAQKVLGCRREAVGIELDGAWQMIHDLAQSNPDRMRSDPLVLHEG